MCLQAACLCNHEYVLTITDFPHKGYAWWFQFQEEKDDLQRKLTILQDDLEKSEARADKMRMEADEKASTLDETERSVSDITIITVCSIISI